MSPLLDAVNISHSFGSFQALAPTDFSLETGQVTFF